MRSTRLMAVLLLAAFAAACLACAGVQPSTTPARDGTAKDKRANPGDTPEYKFGQPVRSGDLLVTVGTAINMTCGGQYHGRYRSVVMLTVWLGIENTHKGKIADWDGWQNTALAEDEHGNQFKRCDLDGWVWLPGNEPPPNEWNGDFKARIAPGVNYRNILYFEPAPATSKQLTITVPLDGKLVRFRGPFGDLQQAALREAKEGTILDAVNLFTDLRKSSTTISKDYPKGCTMRVTGVVSKKTVALSPQHNATITLNCEPEKPIEESATAHCYTMDNKLFDSLKVGDEVTLQGEINNTHRGDTAAKPQFKPTVWLMKVVQVKP